MNKYRIKAQYYYYSGTLYAPKNGFLKDYNGQIIEFTDRKGAESYIEKITDYKNYYLNHGEYAAPKYTVYCFKN